MDFDKAFINSWKNALAEREIRSDIDFYKIKERNVKLPIPKRKKKVKKHDFKITNMIKTIGYLFVMFNILYIILRMAGMDIFKPYGDMIFAIFNRIVLK
ncbi:MAG TPA: hypothetical protein GXX73_14245 [Clostridium sp.]|nr:hypothetical protein [Clostridium sp.]